MFPRTAAQETLVLYLKNLYQSKIIHEFTFLLVIAHDKSLSLLRDCNNDNSWINVSTCSLSRKKLPLLKKVWQ